MDDGRRPGAGPDPVLLIEAVLALAVFALLVFFFLIPFGDPRSGDQRFNPGWWTWPLVALAFFGLVGLDAWRRRRGRGR